MPQLAPWLWFVLMLCIWSTFMVVLSCGFLTVSKSTKFESTSISLSKFDSF